MCEHGQRSVGVRRSSDFCLFHRVTSVVDGLLPAEQNHGLPTSNAWGSQMSPTYHAPALPPYDAPWMYHTASAWAAADARARAWTSPKCGRCSGRSRARATCAWSSEWTRVAPVAGPRPTRHRRERMMHRGQRSVRSRRMGRIARVTDDALDGENALIENIICTVCDVCVSWEDDV